MDKITVTLKRPVEHNGVTYREMTFREIETGDLAIADKFEGENSRMLALLASMSGVPLPAIHKIKLRDFTDIVKEITPLLGEFDMEDGSTSSH